MQAAKTKLGLVTFLVMVVLGSSAGVTISNVRAKQRFPWNGKVDIYFDISSSRSNTIVTLTGKVPSTGSLLNVSTIENTNGQSLSSSFGVAPGSHHVVWDASKDLPNNTVINDFVVSVSASSGVTPSDRMYCVIDLSEGATADQYPVYYLNGMPDGGWTDEYKTQKLVLRRISTGSFKTGGIGSFSAVASCDVTMSKEYYIGVFEITQRQYELVMGSNPSAYKGDLRPVESVSYDDLRGNIKGANWPSSKEVDAESFIGKIRNKSCLYELDLPTEAQWEFACRAGTTTAFNDGIDYTEGAIAFSYADGVEKVARFKNTCNDGRGAFSEHTIVGCYQPNAFGLYDMHGNVSEWCLDWFGEYTEGAKLENPFGPESGSGRVVRGGNWAWLMAYLTSPYRLGLGSSIKTTWGSAIWAHQGLTGFRLALRK